MKLGNIGVFALLLIAALGCKFSLNGGSTEQPSKPSAAPAATPASVAGSIAPIKLEADLTKIDVCAAIPKTMIESAIGRKLVAEPEKMDMPDIKGSSGCSYDAGKDSDGNAYFGYVIFTPADAFETQPLSKKSDVSGLGQKAYFNNGPDARQLWVKLSDSAAMVVAFGDVPNESGAQTIAKAVVGAVK